MLNYGDDIKPTEEEQYLLNILWDWAEMSLKSPIILGKPMGD